MSAAAPAPVPEQGPRVDAAAAEPPSPSSTDDSADASADRTRPVTGDRSVARPVLDAQAVGRALTRMAHEVLEREGGVDHLVVLGIPTRGATLARRLAARLAEIEGRPVASGSLDVTMHRDDLHLRGARPLGATDVAEGQVDDRVVVLVDDVLFSGRTVRAALDALGDLGRPRAVRLAVLVDRGHRELPIRADHVGKNIPTSRREVVHVLLAEHDGRDGVLLGPADLGRDALDAGGPA